MSFRTFVLRRTVFYVSKSNKSSISRLRCRESRNTITQLLIAVTVSHLHDNEHAFWSWNVQWNSNKTFRIKQHSIVCRSNFFRHSRYYTVLRGLSWSQHHVHYSRHRTVLQIIKYILQRRPRRNQANIFVLMILDKTRKACIPTRALQQMNAARIA